MNRTLAATDTVPWYRQFWPWFLIGLPASVVVAALATLYIANRHADDLVAEDYYKNGLAINRELVKIDRAQALGVSGEIKVLERQLRATVAGPVNDDRLDLQLSHPMEADRDLELQLVRIGDGSYTAPLPGGVESRWHWLVESGGADPWRVDGVLQAGDFADARTD
jgi:hypothetical protein